ncbi:MAG: hypothetical protein GF330_12830 [Candidatus Eisenbacteria bacterium]|nr:hypothetical protein [Candidatus Eisenbacteria bacterium]
MNHSKACARAILACLPFLVLLVMLTACDKQNAQDSDSSASTQVAGATVEQVKQWMESGKPLVVLDSRSQHSWESDATKAQGALRVPPGDVESHIATIPRGRRILVYCT